MENGIDNHIYHFLKEQGLLSLSGKGKIALGVSGGCDSMALLYAMHDIVKTMGLDMHVITIDHALREDAQEEIAYVVEHAQKLGVQAFPYKIEGLEKGAGLQEKARIKRHEIFLQHCKEHGCEALFLAHHANDRLESFFHRLIGGSGITGLASIRSVDRHKGLHIYRPLLPFSRDNLEQYLKAKEISWYDDASNEDDQYTRVRLRKLIHGLEEEGLSFKRVSKSLDRLQRADQALDNIIKNIFERSVTRYDWGGVSISKDVFLNLEEDLRVRLIEACLRTVRLDTDNHISLSALERLVNALRMGEPLSPTTLFGCKILVDEHDVWVVAEKPDKVMIAINEDIFYWDNRFIIKGLKGFFVRHYDQEDAKAIKDKIGAEAFEAACPVFARDSLPVIFKQDQKSLFLSAFEQVEHISSRINPD